MKNCLVVPGGSVDPSVPARGVQGNPTVRNVEISEHGELVMMRGRVPFGIFVCLGRSGG